MFDLEENIVLRAIKKNSWECLYRILKVAGFEILESKLGERLKITPMLYADECGNANKL